VPVVRTHVLEKSDTLGQGDNHQCSGSGIVGTNAPRPTFLDKECDKITAQLVQGRVGVPRGEFLKAESRRGHERHQHGMAERKWSVVARAMSSRCAAPFDRLADVHLPSLKKLIRQSVKHMSQLQV
jgi:hypothetical protein